jgi:hypothetical protein
MGGFCEGRPEADSPTRGLGGHVRGCRGAGPNVVLGMNCWGGEIRLCGRNTRGDLSKMTYLFFTMIF